jgi:uncharacterized protein (DUF1499 family)
MISRFTGSRISDFDLNNHPDNPLPECPDSPNCSRATFVLPQEKEILLIKSREALQSMNAAKISFDADSLTIHAVFVIPVFRFRDDVHIALTEEDDNTLLHIRSGSRVGKSDLGVNRRRVKKFLTLINYQN